jgi:hypothetical protein
MVQTKDAGRSGRCISPFRFRAKLATTGTEIDEFLGGLEKFITKNVTTLNTDSKSDDISM